MKKHLLFILLTICATYTFSQTERNTTVSPQTYYLTKSKKQKTASLVMLIGGTALTVTGVAVAVGGGLDCAFGSPDCGKNQTLSDILAISGSAAVLGSIPLFIAANKNKKKAMSLSFGGQRIPELSKTALVYKPVPSIILKIDL